MTIKTKFDIGDKVFTLGASNGHDNRLSWNYQTA